MKNKKGIFAMLLNPWVFIPLLIIIVLGVIFLASSVSGKGYIPSDFTRRDCAVDIEARLDGYLFVDDDNFWGVKSNLKDLEVSSIYNTDAGYQLFSASPLTSFSNDDYTWRVTLTSSKGGGQPSKAEGSDTHPGGNVVQEKLFSLYFTIPDNNCDGQVDDFSAKLEGEVRTEDGQKSTITKNLAYRNGQLTIN